MQLIKKIEINYLRSLYSATLDKIGNLNIIFGRNDSGKSNLLRALNLFFNEETDEGRYFDFDLDMSDLRKKEARDAKGRQFIWIKITFNTPLNYRGVLGPEITIKRQFNRDGDMNQTVFPQLEGPGPQSRLTRFLNDMDFTYVPAIKDLNVYSDMIEKMYASAAESTALKQATQQFVQAIEGQTTELSKQLAILFGGPAHLAPPAEMSELFRSLDFAHGEDEHSLLRQKGDGIKARHLPELLRYINDHNPRTKLHLWGFEEPENSLDLGAAEMEARRFAEFAQRSDTQIFLTSHSPAFYLSGSGDVGGIRRYFITKQLKLNNEIEPKNASSLIDNIDDAESKMETAGLLQLPFAIRHMKKLSNDLERERSAAESLRNELSALQAPTLFVEGRHDVSLFSEAFERIGVGGDVAVKPLGGTPNTPDALLSAVLEQGGINASAITMFLFDNDNAGRSAHKKITNTEPASQPVKYKEKTFVWALLRTEEFNSFLKKMGIQVGGSFFTAEFLFPIDESAQVCRELVDEQIGNNEILQWEENVSGNYWKQVPQNIYKKLIMAERGSPDWLYARGVPSSLKSNFLREMKRREVSTAQIDHIVSVIAEKMI